MSVPAIGGSLAHERATVGAQVLAASLQRARTEAMRRSTGVALQIEVIDQRTRTRLIADGNGNGVLQRDIDRGVDVAISGYEWIDQHARGVSLRINQRVLNIGGSGSLAPGDDPLRIGRTSLVAFGPLGNSTSGTVYVA